MIYFLLAVISNFKLFQIIFSGSVGSAIQHPSIPLPNNVTLPLETQHASLKRKKEAPPPPTLYSPILEKSEVKGV
jgi:hypothetical protein